jgi:hypothetical protein
MKVVYATGTTVVMTPDGGRHTVYGGTHWPVDDPVVRAMPGLFSDDPRVGVSFSVPPAELSDPPVEQATAAPGEKRETRRGRPPLPRNEHGEVVRG